MNEALEAYEKAVNSAHLGTRITFWVVMASVAYLFIRIVFY